MKRTLLLLALLMTGLSHAQTNEEVEIIKANTGLSYEQAMKIYLQKDFVEDIGDALVILDSIHIKQGDYIQIHLPMYDKNSLRGRKKRLAKCNKSSWCSC